LLLFNDNFQLKLEFDPELFEPWDFILKTKKGKQYASFGRTPVLAILALYSQIRRDRVKVWEDVCKNEDRYNWELRTRFIRDLYTYRALK